MHDSTTEDYLRISRAYGYLLGSIEGALIWLDDPKDDEYKRRAAQRLRNALETAATIRKGEA